MENAEANRLNEVPEVDLIYRNTKHASECPPIRSSKEAYEILMKAWDQNKIDLVQQFKIVLLDQNNWVKGVSTVSSGGVQSGVIDLHIIFATAIKSMARGMIMVYNRPSGDISESTRDIEIACKFSEAAKALDIEFQDYMIVSKNDYTSLSDLGVPPFGSALRNS